MKKVTRLIFATLSTLLLAAGFCRASERIDPMTAATSQVVVLDQQLTDGPCGACIVVD